MSNDRRYSEEEVRKIIELAASQAVTRQRPRQNDGLTLADVQSIGAEVGVDATAITRAAAALDAGLTRPPRTSLLMPIEVARVVPLPRAPTDGEWDQIVAELRSTFGARGQVSVHGGLREWRNGNLHASVEPGAGGYRLRMGTVKSDAQGVNAIGASGLLAATIVSTTMIMSGEAGGALMTSVLMGGTSIAAFIVNAVRLPRWANLRARQMEHVADRAGQIVAGES